jgi:ATP-binding cassette subfamily B protein
LIQIAIDDYVAVKDIKGLNYIALVFVLVLLAGSAVRYAQTYLTIALGQKVLHDLRRQVFGHLQKLHLSFFDKNPVGRLVTRVTSDVNTLDEMFSAGVVTIIGDIFTLVLIVGALLYYNWQVALITFAVVPLLAAATFIFKAKVRNVYREVRVRVARINAFLQEHITGIKVVQLFNRGASTYKKFDEINLGLRSAHFRSIYYYAVFFPTVEIIGALAIALVLYFGGFRIQSGDLTFGELVAFLTLVEMFYRPIRDLSDQYNTLQASMASSERIFNLIDTPPELTSPPVVKESGRFEGRIDIEHLWFAYNDNEWVLKDVSFSVEPGQKIAIVGATGAGKSSLVSLLYRFYDYQRGAIRLDGVELRDLSVDKLRSHLGLVLQDVFIFSGDIAGNVRLRTDRISDESVREALNRVGFERFMRRFDDNLHAEIRERGATLSTGQKQLLSFARALAHNPDILILDEATSSVDTETEKMIQAAIDELLRGRTSIIVAHRLSTIEKADRILVLHHGELRESGTHAELMQKQGIYHKLYQLQYHRQMLKPADVPTD